MMRFKNTKYVIYNFLSYEYRHIEDYLEEMALKGWILSDIKGDFLKFKRSEPRSLKYSVDIFDSISLFAGKDNERALEYREYCKKAGWDFVCEREKIQIYFSEGSKEKVEIHTDEFEKFNIIMKASLKHVLLNFINIILLLFPEYLLIFKGTDGRFLANSLSLGVLLQLTIFATHEFTGITNFLLFSIKGRRNLYKGEKVSYYFTASVLIRKVIYKIMLVTTLLVLVVITFEHDFIMLGFFIILLILTAIFNYTISLVKNKNYKNNKITVTISYVLLPLVCFIISAVILNNIIFSKLLEENDNHEYSGIENEQILTLEDFGDKNLGGNLFVDSRKSPIASNMYYSNEGEKLRLSYNLFASKYEWPVKYNFIYEVLLFKVGLFYWNK
ncbi:DUF2812 domain-containing protein [Clostridium isatidis]|uniref:DUF2812 domain-containing protein n=1 Tax=Clostridium isatidis TaxID=182773 RepID=UPI003AAFC192